MRIDDLDNLVYWADHAKELSNSSLEAAAEEADSISMRKALNWSKQVNKKIDELPDERFTRTNGGSTEKVNIGHFRGRETGKCMMFLYNDCTPVLEIRLDDMTVFANSRDPQETERWLDMLAE